MRTTLDLPDEVLRKAKIAAVERGFSLRQLVINALIHEIEGRAPSERFTPNDGIGALVPPRPGDRRHRLPPPGHLRGS